MTFFLVLAFGMVPNMVPTYDWVSIAAILTLLAMLASVMPVEVTDCLFLHIFVGSRINIFQAFFNFVVFSYYHGFRSLKGGRVRL